MAYFSFSHCFQPNLKRNFPSCNSCQFQQVLPPVYQPFANFHVSTVQSPVQGIQKTLFPQILNRFHDWWFVQRTLVAFDVCSKIWQQIFQLFHPFFQFVHFAMWNFIDWFFGFSWFFLALIFLLFSKNLISEEWSFFGFDFQLQSLQSVYCFSFQL